MKKETLFTILSWLAMITIFSSNTLSVYAMGFPNEFKAYFDEHGIDVPSIEDIGRASLATGVHPVTGAPITEAQRKEAEARLGISSTPAPAASAPAAAPAQTPAPAVQKHEHTYSSGITREPTCTDPGEETFTCDGCAASYVDEVAPLGHDYVESVTKEASCTEEGEMSYACSRCDDSYTEAIPAAGHRYSGEYTADLEPTCTTDGEQSKHCLVCGGRTEITAVPAAGHTESVSYEVSTPATMFAAGEEVMRCAVCSDVIATRVIPQDTGSLYAVVGGTAVAVLAVIGIILAVKKKRNASAEKPAGENK